MSDIALTHFFLPVKDMEYTIRSLGHGTQILFRFANGAGVSVIRGSQSYGLFEAAPLMYLDDSWENWDFIGKVFELPGFADRDDVKRYLDLSDVDEIIAMVASL